MRTLVLVLVALAVAPVAAGAGLPLTDSGAPAIVSGSKGGRYVALPTARGTVVARLGTVVYTSRLLPGRYTVPVVALDGTPGGLSADRTTLVLISPRRSFPRARTTLAVLDARSLRLRSTIALEGDFSFDAISPDGSRLYLVHYLSQTDPTRYEVRSYDLAGGRLLPEPIVDPTEVDETMRGYPITRTTRVDGRFAYTLYDGAGKTPFVHALDTVDGEARCIDLAALAGRDDLYDLRLSLSLGGTRLAVVSGDSEVTAVDTKTSLPARATVATTSSSRWPLVALVSAVVLLALGGCAFVLRRRYRERAYQTFPGPL